MQGVREELRGTYAGPRIRTGARIPRRPRHHRRRAAADPPHRRRAHLARAAGLRTTGATRSIGYLAPHALYAATGARGEQVKEFKGMVKALHSRRDRGDPRRRLQPHRRGQPPRADARLQGRSTTSPTTARCPSDPRYYMDYTGTGNSLNPVHPSRAAADHGLAALLRDRVPRRRLPLRPRVARSPASSTTSTGSRPSSTSSTRIRSCPR